MQLRDVMIKREFERYLSAAGATRSQRDRAAAALPPHAMRALLPLWRRIRIAWRCRRG